MSIRHVVLFAALISSVADQGQAEIRPDFLMDTNPDCTPLPPLRSSMKEHKALWIETLNRPEIDLQRMSAESIAMAREKGITGLNDAIPGLEKILMAESTHPAARFAAARALVVLESRGSAEKLFQASQKYGSELRQLVEPALAQWDFGPIKPIWLKRLDTPTARRTDFMLAAQGVAIVQESQALPVLRAMVLDLNQAADIRLEAASASGQLIQTGLDEDAERLSKERRSNAIVNRHCALRLLARHDSDQARRVLTELAQDTEPSIIAASLKRLFEIDPALVLPHTERGLKNADANVRHQAARAYVSLPSPERIPALARLLDDPHPDNRRRIREDLYQLAAKPELNESIRTSAMEILKGDPWRGQEQSILLLGQLEHQPAAARFVELLESDRNEVSITAGWGLRKLANVQTTAAILDKIRRQTIVRKVVTRDEIDLQVGHLFEACGRIRAKEGESLMLEYVPKDLLMGERSRSAAVWALGWLHEGVPDDALGQKLLERINDTSIIPPESFLLKRQAIITLARMKAVSFAANLRIPVENGTSNEPVAISRVWAIEQLTGEKLPGPKPDTIGYGTWFLEPVIPPGSESKDR